MSKNTSLVTTFSGLIGGGTTAAQEVAAASNPISPVDYGRVIIAAIISAIVAYAVKLLLDVVVNAIKNYKK